MKRKLPWLSISVFFPPCACKGLCTFVKNKTNLNNKKHTYLMHLTSWLKIHPFKEPCRLYICSGWIFTHTSGRWTWELMCWQMAARAVNNWTLGSQGPFLTVDNTQTLQTHSVYECISLSLSYSVMIHDDLYTLQHYTETVYKVLVVLYKVRRAKHFNSLSGVTTVFANLELVCCMQIQ